VIDTARGHLTEAAEIVSALIYIRTPATAAVG